MKNTIFLLSFFICFYFSTQAQNNIEIILVKGKGTIFSKQLNRNVQSKDKLSLTGMLRFSDKNTVLVGVLSGRMTYFSIDQNNMKPNTFYNANSLMLPSSRTRDANSSLCHLFKGAGCENDAKPLVILANLKIQMPADYSPKDIIKYYLQHNDQSIAIKTEGDFLIFDEYIYADKKPEEVKNMNLICTSIKNNVTQKIDILPLWVSKEEIKPVFENIKAFEKNTQKRVDFMWEYLNNFYGLISKNSVMIWVNEN